MLDFLIKNGHVVDPYQEIDGICDIGIRGRRIVSAQGEPAARVIDADGCYVFPGLIDNHVHAYHGGSNIGVQPDLMLSTGVTTVVDAGTAGWGNYRAFRNSVLNSSKIRIFSLINYNASGLIQLGNVQPYTRFPQTFQKIQELYEDFHSELVGLKILVKAQYCGANKTIQTLREMIEVAETVSAPIVVHTTSTDADNGEIAKLLRKGDIFCHCYQKSATSILDENGKVKPEIWDARARGVLFDASNGVGNFNFDVALPALEQGFTPDIISTDISTVFGIDNYCRNLPYLMSKWLTLGLPLSEVVRCVTQTPASLLPDMQGQIGTLANGAWADIAIMRMIQKEQHYMDSDKNPEKYLKGDRILVPEMTFLRGECVFRSNDFN